MGTEERARATGAFLALTPFVGRENENARLRARLAEARTGRGGLVMLVGDPGNREDADRRGVRRARST